ncbi:hypothetical protein RND81_14G251700 [Saponaria officinalis]|uniref:BHLH domain-containing protein n=1 Tax=Saponaria officinalis TaxID=3572 RepID=A0AAW1GV28_SAPOF
MNRAYADMLHCLNTANVAGVKGMEMSVLEQQNIVFKRQQAQNLQLQQQQHEMSCFNELSMLSFLPPQAQELHALDMDCGRSAATAGPTLNELMNRPIKADPSIENGWMNFAIQQSGVAVQNSGVESVSQVNSPCYGTNYAISRTASCPPVVPVVAAAMKTGHSDVKGTENTTSELKLNAAIGRESFNKRKAEKNQATPKVIEAEINNSKRSKVCVTEEESNTAEQYSNRNSSQSKQKHNSSNKNVNKERETSGCTSKDNSKASEVQKPDYIHVRARRGQATDSHSLAERVRREKISERMRYLQDLVPGCNKITGKAGMLDEIINYVQSLQRQVEFLSMKLAAVSPRLEFNIDDLISREILAACSSSLPTMGVSPDLSNPNYPQYNPIQQIDQGCGSETIANSIDMRIRRSISTPVSMPENFFDTSSFNQIQNSIQWDADLHNLYNMEFQQGISTSVPFQAVTGNNEAHSLKMEM